MLSDIAPYETRSHFTDGLLEVIRILGTYITPNPDASYDSMAAENYQHGNRTIADDLLEEIIIRLDAALGGAGGGGGSSLPEILRSATDLNGAVPSGYAFGYSYTSGKMYIRSASNQWQLVYDPTIPTYTAGANVNLDGQVISVFKTFDTTDEYVGQQEIMVIDNVSATPEHASVISIARQDFIRVIKGMRVSGQPTGKIVHLKNTWFFPVLLKARKSGYAEGFIMNEDYPLLPGSMVSFMCDEQQDGWQLIGSEFNWNAALRYTSQEVHHFMTTNNSDKHTFFVSGGGSNFLKSGTAGLQGQIVHRVTNVDDRAAVLAGTLGFGAGNNNLIVGGNQALLKFSALVSYNSLNDSANEYRHNIGFMRNGNPGPANGIYFRYANDTGQMKMICVDNGVDTTVTAGPIIQTNKMLFLEILVYPNGQKVEFFINNEPVAEITTNIPVGTGREFTYGSSLHKIAGTNQRDMYLEVMDFKSLSADKIGK